MSYDIAFLVNKANELGCTIDFSDKINANFDFITMTIITYAEPTLENIYTLAHEIGHVMDFVDDKLEYEEWKYNKSYRIAKEMSAWVNSYGLLTEMNVPLDKWSDFVEERMNKYLSWPFEDISGGLTGIYR